MDSGEYAEGERLLNECLSHSETGRHGPSALMAFLSVLTIKPPLSCIELADRLAARSLRRRDSPSSSAALAHMVAAVCAGERGDMETLAAHAGRVITADVPLEAHYALGIIELYRKKYDRAADLLRSRIESGEYRRKVVADAEFRLIRTLICRGKPDDIDPIMSAAYFRKQIATLRNRAGQLSSTASRTVGRLINRYRFRAISDTRSPRYDLSSL